MHFPAIHVLAADAGTDRNYDMMIAYFCCCEIDDFLVYQVALVAYQ